MASSTKSFLILFFVGSLFLDGALGEIICESLPTNVCAFSIASSGKRCLLENTVASNGKVEYQCKTSEVVVGGSVGEHIETDECVKACGVDRKSIGLSSDSLIDPVFTSHLCSPACYQNCPNIVDIYFNLAAGEGVYLPEICEKLRSNPSRRDMAEVQSAFGPTSYEGNGPINSMTHWASSPALLNSLVEGGEGSPSNIADSPAQQRSNNVPRRAMVEIMSGGAVSPGPVEIGSPAPAPST